MELQSVDIREASGVGTESTDENSAFSAQFCCEVKSALKNSLFKKMVVTKAMQHCV